MPNNGQIWTGKGGFMYKKAAGGGGRHNPPYGLILGQESNIYNKYISGPGVGGVNTSVRRAKLNRAVICDANHQCGPFYRNLGVDRFKASIYQRNGGALRLTNN